MRLLHAANCGYKGSREQVQNQDILRNVTDAIRATAAEAISSGPSLDTPLPRASQARLGRYLEQRRPELVWWQSWGLRKPAAFCRQKIIQLRQTSTSMGLGPGHSCSKQRWLCVFSLNAKHHPGEAMLLKAVENKLWKSFLKYMRSILNFCRLAG